MPPAPKPPPSPYIPPQPNQPSMFRTPANWYERAVNRVPYTARNVQVQNGLPGFLGDRMIIVGSWFVAMAAITYDEWITYTMSLPRPARYWKTSLLFGLIAAASAFSPIVPICNAFAVGYAMIVLYQIFGAIGAKQAAQNGSGPTSSSNRPVRPRGQGG